MAQARLFPGIDDQAEAPSWPSAGRRKTPGYRGDLFVSSGVKSQADPCPAHEETPAVQTGASASQWALKNVEGNAAKAAGIGLAEGRSA